MSGPARSPSDAAGGAPPPPAVRLWNRDFTLLWQGQLVSQLGNQAFSIALLYWLMEATGSGSLMGLLMTTALLPTVLLAPFGGALADRFSRRRILVLSDLVRGLTILAACAVLLADPTATTRIVATLFVVSLVGGVTSAVFQPAISAAIPDLVPPGRLASANSLQQISSQASTMLGQSVGGVLYGVLGAPLLFLFDGLTFLFSALSESWIRLPERAGAAAGGLGALWRDTSAGFAHLWRRRGLRGFLLIAAGVNFFAMPIFVLLPFFAERQLERGAAWYGFLLAAIGAGAVAGSILAGVLRGRLGASGLLASLLVLSAALAGLGQIGRPAAALGAAFVIGLASGFVNVQILTGAQLSTPPQLRGRVLSFLVTVSGAATPLGMLAGGVAGDVTGMDLPLVYGAAGAGVGALFLVALLRPSIRRFLDEVSAATD